MSNESFPFFESSEAATRHAIEASGRDMKDVAHALWPDRNPLAARTLLLNALNENRAERLTADQHAHVARICGRYDWLYYVCYQLGHSRPVPQTPADQAAEIQHALFKKAEEMRGLLNQIEQLKPKLRAVS